MISLKRVCVVTILDEDLAFAGAQMDRCFQLKPQRMK
jgi:hypothetical protein